MAHPCQWQDDKTNGRTTTTNMKDEVISFPLCFFLLTNHLINPVTTDPASQHPLKYQPPGLTVWQQRGQTTTTKLAPTRATAWGMDTGSNKARHNGDDTRLPCVLHGGGIFFQSDIVVPPLTFVSMWGSQYIYVDKNVVPRIHKTLINT